MEPPLNGPNLLSPWVGRDRFGEATFKEAHSLAKASSGAGSHTPAILFMVISLNYARDLGENFCTRPRTHFIPGSDVRRRMLQRCLVCLQMRKSGWGTARSWSVLLCRTWLSTWSSWPPTWTSICPESSLTGRDSRNTALPAAQVAKKLDCTQSLSFSSTVFERLERAEAQPRGEWGGRGVSFFSLPLPPFSGGRLPCSLQCLNH